MLANINRNRKKRAKPYTPKDFMPVYKKKKQSPDEMLETVKKISGEPGKLKIDMTGKSAEEIKEIVERLNKENK